MSVKKIALLSVITMMNPCQANFKETWRHVCSVTQSLTESPKGDFSYHKIAVVDNGFDINHEGLRPALDGNAINGRDGGEDVAASIVGDIHHRQYGKYASHGTHVAGIITQMLPHITVVPCKRGSSGHRTVEADKKCLEKLLKRDDVQIVNLSFGIDWMELLVPIINLAIKGKTVVIAAGNENNMIKDLNVDNRHKLSDFLNHEAVQNRVVFVGATTTVKDGLLAKKRVRAPFSNYPCESLEPFFIGVPGTEVNSFVPRDIGITGFKKASGTSMAAPIFASCLMRLATEFDISVDEARQALFNTSIKVDMKYGGINHKPQKTGSGIMSFEAARNFLKQQRMTRGIVLHASPETDEYLTALLEGAPTTAEEGRRITNTHIMMQGVYINDADTPATDTATTGTDLPHFGFEFINGDTTAPEDIPSQESGFIKTVFFDAPIAAAQGAYDYMRSFLPS